MSKFDDISGQRFGRLIAIKPVGKRWEFLCDCGNSKLIWATNVKRGHSKSCGCFHRESISKNGKARTRHGFVGTSEYHTWQGLRQRCENPKDKDFPRYGGRGIKVCERWNSFPAFIEDMGRKPSRRHSLDRIDIDGDYSAENCRWATHYEQSRNKRLTIRVEAFGKSGCLADFVSPYSYQYSAVNRLIKNGLLPHLAIMKICGTNC